MKNSIRSWVWPHIDADIAGEPRHIIAVGVVVILVFCLGFLAWLAWVPVAGAIAAPGVLKVVEHRRPIQHLSGGVIRQVLVKNGDQVKAGQSLVVFDDPRAAATYDSQRQQEFSMRAKIARLEAEQALAIELKFPDELQAQANNPALQGLLDREQKLFQARRGSLAEVVRLLEEQQGDIRKESERIAEQIKSAQEALRLMQEEVKANASLLEEGITARVRVVALQRSEADYSTRVTQLQAEQQRTRQKAVDTAMRVTSAKTNFMESASSELKTVTDALLNLQQELRPSEQAARRQVLTAPSDGQIIGLQVYNAGTVVTPGAVLMELMPEKSKLLVEARINVDDYHYIPAGAAVDVRLKSFSSRSTPMIQGHVTYVSADRLNDRETPFPYYMVHVELDTASLQEAGNPPIQPGMPAQVYIHLRERTLLDYLLEPITDSMHRAFREP